MGGGSSKKKDATATTEIAKGGGTSESTSASSKNAAPQPAGGKDVSWKTIHSAARWGKLDDLKVDVNPSNINCPDPDNGNRPIHIAAQNGHLEIVELFLKTSGCAVNAQNNNGLTALHMAVEYDYYWVAKKLLGAGANGNIESNDGHKAMAGIEGQKTASSFNLMALKEATDGATTMSALKLCLDNAVESEPFDKAEVAQTFMKKRKALKADEQYTDEIDAKFQELLGMAQ